MLCWKSAVITVMLLTACLHYSNAVPSAVEEASTCCYTFAGKPVSIKRLKGFYWTSSTCSKKAVVLITMKNKEICTNPEFPWVKTIMKTITQKKNQH
ncbi:monocyte chemotactic protein 1B-like [Protopterus annectens]|uniref:monocyte chemotactic protein 1B-like n=1 Tax=Protopterus annectens TaxID=7888 RepID=UPI001CF99E94|nr:monocyte chemotactic protein 1B-like [Protopterus annectens]